MTAGTLMELARRAEMATGPDRELDADIGLTLAQMDTMVWHAKVADADSHLRGFYLVKDAEWGFYRHRTAPPYTTSIDIARALVPEGWRFASLSERNCTLPNWSWKAELWHPEFDTNVRGIARNADAPCFAVIAAALRARAEQSS